MNLTKAVVHKWNLMFTKAQLTLWCNDYSSLKVIRIS